MKVQVTRQSLGGLDQGLASFEKNLAVLQSKLPDMSKFVRKTESQIKRELAQEKGEGTIIDISKKDDDED